MSTGAASRTNPGRRGRAAKGRLGVIFDLTGAQSPSYRGRGIARYSIELVKAVVEAYPELVSSVAVHNELPVLDDVGELGPWLTNEPDFSAGGALHMTSVMEPEVPVELYWPREASANRLLTAVTVYDLIPEIFPGWYLADPGLRRRWRCCREVVRAADHVFTLSQSARDDTISLLGVPGDRVTVLGSGTAFRPAASPAEALKVARRSVRGLRKGFVLYAGAFNPRKNVDRLIEGYASLPADLVGRHQLVIACQAPPLTRNHYLVMAKDLGLEGRVLIPGYVPEDAFIALHQAAELAVFPSLYEGYGFPVVDAMACGTPAIGGDNSSLRELLPREARFQPEDPWAIGEAITRALTDRSHRKSLLALTHREPPSWASVAERAAVVFEQMLRRASARPPAWRRRPAIATVSMPPELAGELASRADCDNFAGPFEPPDDGSDLVPWAALERLDRWRGGYDAIVGWGGAFGERDLVTMEHIGEKWGGRALAVAGPGTAGDSDAVRKVESWGVRILTAHAGWPQAAQLIAEAAGATG